MRMLARHSVRWKPTYQRAEEILCSTAIRHNFSGSIGPLILCQVIQQGKGQLWYNTCTRFSYWLSYFGLSLVNNRVVHALASIIPWCRNIASRCFYLPNFLPKKSYNDRGVVMYAYLTGWKYAVTYLYMGSKSLILTSSLYLPVREADPSEDSCARAVLFRWELLTQTEKCW